MASHTHPTEQSSLMHAEEACAKSGVRLTDKRKKILATLLASQRALSAYEIVDSVRLAHSETMPPMSVYRILDFLEGENLVHKLNSANKYVACSHIACNHAHEIPQFLICSQCGQVKEIAVGIEIINALEERVKNAGYHLNTPQLELNCICEACLK